MSDNDWTTMPTEVWLADYHRAHLYVSRMIDRTATFAELDFLAAWTRKAMDAYVEGCLATGWVWSATSASDRDEMAGWIAADLEIEKAHAMQVCETAGWPERNDADDAEVDQP